MRKIPVLQGICCPRIPYVIIDRQRVETTALLFAALADPNRLGILKLLVDVQGEVCVCDIADHFTLGQSTISHHLKILREAHLVVTCKRGKWVYYSVEMQRMEEAKTLMTSMFAPPGISTQQLQITATSVPSGSS